MTTIKSQQDLYFLAYDSQAYHYGIVLKGHTLSTAKTLQTFNSEEDLKNRMNKLGYEYNIELVDKLLLEDLKL